MTGNDPTFWTYLEHDLASLTPLVEKVLERAGWTTTDLYTSTDGFALVEATNVVRTDQGRQFTRPEPMTVESGTISTAGEDKVLAVLAVALADLIAVRARVATTRIKDEAELVALEDELTATAEAIRVITGDAHAYHRNPRSATNE